MRGQKSFYANENQMKAGVAILISYKMNFKIKGDIKDKKRTLHNDQAIKPKRKYNNDEYIGTPPP